ncbi:hypothetical protein ABEB36_013947 [Hypothenemus hampei]|uniref:Uncharacterized protein n=1 Tax=Hypothenemus hampei TaxID=57062 RepID=A0ABD1E6P7_HYPHA
MKPENFYDFAEYSKIYAFKNIPFSKVVNIRFTQNIFEVEYKTEYDAEYQKISIKNCLKRLGRKRVAKPKEVFPQPKILKKAPEISASKRDALCSMMSVMNQQDKEFYKTLLKIK